MITFYFADLIAWISCLMIITLPWMLIVNSPDMISMFIMSIRAISDKGRK